MLLPPPVMRFDLRDGEFLPSLATFVRFPLLLRHPLAPLPRVRFLGSKVVVASLGVASLGAVVGVVR